MASPPAWERVEELVALLVDLYGRGLARITQIAEDQGAAGQDLIARLAADEFVASLLVLHGLHPVAVEERIQGALEKVRPYLGSHAGGVEFLGVDGEGVVHLRLEGSCDGCPSSLVTVKLAIERAIHEAAPEVTRVEVENLVAATPAPRLAQIQPSPGNGSGGAKWAAVDGVSRLSPGEMTAVEVEGSRVVVCRVDGTLYAYRNACSSCGSDLAAAGLEGQLLTCPACGQRYDLRLAGRSLESRDLHLEPLPLLTNEGQVKIAVAS